MIKLFKRHRCAREDTPAHKEVGTGVVGTTVLSLAWGAQALAAAAELHSNDPRFKLSYDHAEKFAGGAAMRRLCCCRATRRAGSSKAPMPRGIQRTRCGCNAVLYIISIEGRSRGRIVASIGVTAQ
jgi:hypothetical protein